MSTNHVHTITEQNLDAEVLASEVPVLVDFTATWCPPCRALAPSRAEASPKPVAFLTSTSASTTAADTLRGGPFTQAIVRALGRVESIAASAGAVTVQSAYLYATSEASDQSPRLRGTLDQLPLAWPRDPQATPIRATLETQGATAGTAITELTATLETRQIGGSVVLKENKRTGERNLQVSALLGEDAEWIRVGVYAFTEKNRAEIEILAPSLDGPRFRKGQRVKLAIPVREGLPPGTYRVEVQPCGPGYACGGHAAAKFNVEL